jgi:hypothetical protein
MKGRKMEQEEEQAFVTFRKHQAKWIQYVCVCVCVCVCVFIYVYIRYLFNVSKIIMKTTFS